MVLGMLCVVCYINSINAPFVFDDKSNIVDNPSVHIDTISYNSLYIAGFRSVMPSRPVANVSFALNYYIDKLDVTTYHLVNIVIHFINGLLVYFLSCFVFLQTAKIHRHEEIRDSTRIIYLMAMLSAAIFIAHPVQIQSVTYIVQRMNSMAVMFYLFSIITYLLGRTSEYMVKRRIYYSICVISWFLALGSKEIAATLPLAILLIELYFFQATGRYLFRKNLVPVALLSILMILVSLYFLGENPVDRIMHDYQTRGFSMSERLLTECRVLVFYLSLVLLPLPSRLNLLHEFEISHSLVDPPTTLISIFLLAAMFLFAVYSVKRHRLLSFCILWFFLHLLVESSIIGLEIIFEHRLYLPMAGVSMAVSWYIFSWTDNKQVIRFVSSIALILLLSTATFFRNQTWATEIKLWTDVIHKNPESYRAYFNLANDLAERGKDKEAITNYLKTIEINPGYARAHNNLGIILKKQGNTSAAINHYHLAMAVDPGNYKTYYNLALALDESGNPEQAAVEYKNAIRINPDYADAYYNLGNLLDRMGKTGEAKIQFRETIRIMPEHAMAYNNLGIILAGEKKYEEAINSIKKAIELNPDYYGAYINLGKLYLSINDTEQACLQYRTGIKIKPDLKILPEPVKQLCNLK